MLVNLTKGKVLSEHVQFARSFFQRALGLMFKKEFNGALIFPINGRTSFHGFFCNFPILLICLKHHRVVCKKILKPWTVVEVDGDTVIEMDARKEVPVDVGDEVVILEDSGD